MPLGSIQHGLFEDGTDGLLVPSVDGEHMVCGFQQSPRDIRLNKRKATTLTRM